MVGKKISGSIGGVKAVAEAAGVSKSTVSRAFNTPEIVNVAVRTKIFEVAARMNYRPHPAARALRSQRTHIFGAAIPTLDYAIYARMINEFESTLSSLGASMIIVTTGFDNRNVFDKVRQLVDRGAEALLLVGEIEDLRLKEYIRHSHVPVLTTYSAPHDDSVPSVGFDNYKVVAESVKYLIDLGHRDFAMIANVTIGNDRQRARIAAYQDAISTAGLKGSDYIYTHAYGMRIGANILDEILSDHPETTAVICSSDVFAIGAISACRRRGLRVPQDISIVGCDDFDFAELLDPPLTTVAVPALEMGRVAANELWSAIANNEPVEDKLFETELIVRGSSAPPPSRS